MVTVHATSGGPGDAWRCEVEVEHSGQRTHHTVAVGARDRERFGCDDDAGDVEDLVRRSFEFLLEREPPSSILREFDLSVIRRYFPEYDQSLRR